MVTRVTLGDVPPATLALARLVLGSLALSPLALRETPSPPPARHDRWTIAWMGIVVEPPSLMLLGPALLGERLTGREAFGAVLAVAGALVVVVNGVPGVTERLVPHWRGDLLLILSGLAYASYSLLGRRVLDRHTAGRVTALSVLWGALTMLPLALGEWLAGQRPVWTGAAVAGTLYLALVVTALGYLVWNWALRRVEAARAASR